MIPDWLNSDKVLQKGLVMEPEGKPGTKNETLMYYSARRLMGSRIIESAAYCNQMLFAQVQSTKHVG